MKKTIFLSLLLCSCATVPGQPGNHAVFYVEYDLKMPQQVIYETTLSVLKEYKWEIVETRANGYIQTKDKKIQRSFFAYFFGTSWAEERLDLPQGPKSFLCRYRIEIEGSIMKVECRIEDRELGWQQRYRAFNSEPPAWNKDLVIRHWQPKYEAQAKQSAWWLIKAVIYKKSK